MKRAHGGWEGEGFALLPSELQEVLARMGCVHTSLHPLRSMPCSSVSQGFPCWAHGLLRSTPEGKGCQQVPGKVW